MPRYSILVTTTREVVLNAPNHDKARSRALLYARDVFPTVGTSRTVHDPQMVPDSYTSRTSDDADEIPRDT